jgi:hypothetical protein
MTLTKKEPESDMPSSWLGAVMETLLREGSPNVAMPALNQLEDWKAP